MVVPAGYIGAFNLLAMNRLAPGDATRTCKGVLQSVVAMPKVSLKNACPSESERTMNTT